MDIEIQGLKECLQNLKTLPENVQKNIARGAVYNGANFVRDHLKEAAPILQPSTVNPHERQPGELRDAIVAVMAKGRPGLTVGGIRIRNRADIAASIKKAAKRSRKGKEISTEDALAANNSVRWWTAVEYGHSSKARPFLRSTWDRIATRTLEYMRDYMTRRIIDLKSEWLE